MNQIRSITANLERSAHYIRELIRTLAQSPFDKLDTPCLIRVLQQVSPQRQLVACGAVCSKWRAATREAISSIAVRRTTQKKCDQLQQWLVHPPAALYRLTLHLSIYWMQPGLRLQLSVLQNIKDLKLHGVHLEAVAADGSVLKVADLLPMLQQCTKLAYVARDDDILSAAAVAAFKDMPALQDLELECHDLPGLDLAALPTTLTRLSLTDAPCITSTSAAGFSQLTGLRVLEVSAFGCDASVLAKCSALERVVLNIGLEDEVVFSGEAGFNTPLLVFANMPSLQHLELKSAYEDPVATTAEVAALSVSSNLTYLSLGDSEYCYLPPAAYDSWFPPGRQCPLLQHVDVGVWVLGNTAAVQRMVSACPGLQELELRDLISNIPLECASVAASLQALTNLTSLTRLRVDSCDLPEGSYLSTAVIAAWSHWTNLQQLELTVKYNQVEDLLVLSQLRSLHKLVLGFGDTGFGCGWKSLSTQGGSSPDVWCQVPAVLWGTAVTQTQQQVERLQHGQHRQQAHVAELLEQQQTAQAEAAVLSEQQAAAEADAAALSQQHAAAVERAAALRQQQAKAQAQVVVLQHQQAAAQANVAALQEQQAAEQAKVTALLQKQQQAEAAALRVRLQEQQAEMAAMRQQIIQAEAGQAQLQGQVASLQATVAALLARQG